MDKEKMDQAMEHLRKMAEGFMGLMGVIGEEVTSFVNKAVSEAKEHKHKHKEKCHEDETPTSDETKKE
jgi:DNA-binding ferritin-like protein (Dps family)